MVLFKIKIDAICLTNLVFASLFLSLDFSSPPETAPDQNKGKRGRKERESRRRKRRRRREEQGEGEGEKKHDSPITPVALFQRQGKISK